MTEGKKVKVTCRNCGSDEINEVSRVLISQPVGSWRLYDDDLIGEDYETGDQIGDSIEAVEFPYDCKGCGSTELTEDDLLITEIPEDNNETGEPGEADPDVAGT